MSGSSETTADDLYDGQTIDARLRSDAWLRSGFDSSDWTPAIELADADLSVLTPYVGPPVVRHEEIAPVSVWTSPTVSPTTIAFASTMSEILRTSSAEER